MTRRHVIRVDSKARHQHGWRARVFPPGTRFVHRLHGQKFPRCRSRFFADQKHGGRARAEAAARRWARRAR